MAQKTYDSAAAALDGLLFDGMTIAAEGFALCGIPESLIGAIRASGVRNLTIISNNAGVDDFGLGLLLRTRQVRKVTSSYVGENKEFERQYLAGELQLEVNPQGTLAKRLRAVGVGTIVAEGKEETLFNSERSLLETGLVADLAIVKAWRGDTHANLVYRKTARHSNPMAATRSHTTVADVEEIAQRNAEARPHSYGRNLRRLPYRLRAERRTHHPAGGVTCQ
jgi:3-oxoacid CoA-transferase subunit A